MGEEEWRAVAGWPYEVSNVGRVRRSGRGNRTRPGFILKPFQTTRGYTRVNLHRDGTDSKHFSIHRLVAQAFLGEPPAGTAPNHKNGIKADNRVENLEWATQSENMKHAYATGLLGRGEMHGRARLTEPQAREILERYRKGDSPTRMAKEFGVSQGLVSQIGCRRIWKHLDQQT